jgi:cobalamin biosynthesis protein CobD/CbiB
LARGLLADWGALLAWALDVTALYLCLGFRPGMARAAEVSAALMRRELEEARRLWQAWRPGLMAGADVGSLSRQVTEEVLKLALGRLFTVLFWFLLLDAAGAVLYFLTRLARDGWHGDPTFAAFATQVCGWLEWLPARLLAFSFAIVGNFQDAMEAWRTQAPSWGVGEEGCVLAAGAGALGVRLGGRLHLSEGDLARPDLGVEEPAGPETLAAAEALVWRAVMLWLAVLLLLWLGGS